MNYQDIDTDTTLGYYDDTVYQYDPEAERLAYEEELFLRDIENPLPHFGTVEYYFYATSDFSRLQAWFEQQTNAFQMPRSTRQYPMMVREYPVNPYYYPYDTPLPSYTLQITLHDPQYRRTIVRVHKHTHDSPIPEEVAMWNGKLKGKALYRMIMAIAKLYNCATIEGTIPREILQKVTRPATSPDSDRDDGTAADTDSDQSQAICTQSADTPTVKPC